MLPRPGARLGSVPDPPDDDSTRIESDLDPRRRRVRNLVFVGLPTLAATVLVLLLGLPTWVVLVFLVLFAGYVVANS